MNTRNFGKEIRENIPSDDRAKQKEKFLEAANYYTEQIIEAINPIPSSDVPFVTVALLKIVEYFKAAEPEGYMLGEILEKKFDCGIYSFEIEEDKP